MADKFTLDNFREQLAAIAKPGLMQKMLSMLPGMGAMRAAVDDFDISELKGMFGIIDAMTPAERADSKLIDRSRRSRIAAGAGCTPREVSLLLDMYEPMAQLMGRISTKRSINRRRDATEEIERHGLRWPLFPLDDEGDDPPPDDPWPPITA